MRSWGASGGTDWEGRREEKLQSVCKRNEKKYLNNILKK